MAANAYLRRLAKTVSRQPEWILALIASLAVIWLHFYFLWHAGGFWRDEVNLINLSGRHSLAEMSKDSFPVLMPLLVSGWSALGLGQNDLSLRLLGTLIGLALPAALWLAAWNIRRAPPMIGLVLLALNSTVIKFGDSLRAFGLGSVLVLITTATAGWFLKNPTWRRAACVAALAVLSVQALYQNAVFIAAICFGVWTVCARQKNGRAAVKILIAGAAAAASLLPYWTRIVSLPNAAASLRTGFMPMYALINFDNAAGFPMEQYTRVWEFFALLVAVYGCASLFARTRNSAEFAGGNPPENAPLFVGTTLVMAVVAVSGFFWFCVSPATRWWFFPLMAAAIAWCDAAPPGRAVPGTRITGRLAEMAGGITAPVINDMALFAGVTLLAAFAGFAGFLWFAALITEPWYFLPLLALIAAAFELGLPFNSRHFRAAIFGFAAASIALAIPAARGDLNWRFTNIDLVSQRLAAEAGPDDFIIVSPWYCGITFDRYYKGPASWNTLPPLADHSIHHYDLVLEKMETRGAIQPVLDQMAATLQAGHRVWVVGRIDIPVPGKPLPPDLPLPPLKFSSWSDQPYSRNWIAQAAGFLSNHSRRFQQVYYSTNVNVNVTEDLQLNMAEGWQGSANLGPPINARTNAP
jgi:hypothetical protein